jgi:hypothetical protein
MTDSDQNISQDVSDGAVRRFLLGQLSANEQPGFEQRLFLDNKLEARVRQAEFELADDYACSRLRAGDRERFQQRFLTSDDRKLKLKVSNALHDRFALTPTPVRLTTRFVKQFQSLLNFNRLIVRVGFGVAMLVVVVGSTWLMIKKEQSIKDGIKRVVEIRRVQPSSAPRGAHHAPDNSAPEHRTPSKMPGHEPAAPSPMIETIILLPNVLPESGKAPYINVSAGAHDTVRLGLAIKPEPSASYQAQLSTVEGQAVVTDESLKAIEVGANEIYFAVPVRLLKAGDYKITLRRVNDTSKEGLGSYYFRVISLADANAK